MDYKINEPVVLEILDGNDWRVMRTTYRQAIQLLKKPDHGGYLLYREGGAVGTPSSPRQIINLEGRKSV